ncbi:MAG: formimidoylglutamate deiminase [Saprospiraceae bacterium]
MKAFQFQALLQNDEWLSPAFVHLNKDGTVQSIRSIPELDVTYENVDGYALPGLQNAHSHAFQYAMVGMTERHDLKENPDNFWSWRAAMYRLALSVNPDEMEAIAAQLYSEMLRHGYTSVAEFHYLHHDKNGQPYANLAELGSRLIVAAQTAGIKITLVPIFYQKGGFGENSGRNQRRFISKKLDDYLKLFVASQAATKNYHFANTAYGVHSLRAVEPLLIKEMQSVVDHNLPFHLHVAEQLKEIKDSLDYLQQRPVEWLLDNINLNENFHLVHATHLTEAETLRLAKTGANVVLCPSTEGNLGDGIFNLKKYQDVGGNWSIGTDSHVGLNPFEELRILDYGKRMTTHQRNTFINAQQSDSGLFALQKSVIAGRKAMGNFNDNFFKQGESFDALVMDASAPLLQVTSFENLTSTIVYSSDVSMHLGTIVAGKWCVKNGRHLNAEKIQANFIKRLKSMNYR